jgi:integrase
MQKLIKFITIEEFKKILNKEKDKKYKLAYVLGFGSGLRISEVLNLQFEDVNLKEHQIFVRQGKGQKDRVTVTSPWLNGSNISSLPLNIPTRTLQARITRLGKKVLQKQISFHTLRHGFGNYMVNEKGLPMPLVQSMMGHSRIDTTGIYTKANPKQAIQKAWEVF